MQLDSNDKPVAGSFTDAEMALQVAVILSDGSLPAEFETTHDFFEAIGLKTDSTWEAVFTKSLAMRALGIPFERFNLEKMIGDLTGWDKARVLTALIEAEGQGWLKRDMNGVVFS